MKNIANNFQEKTLSRIYSKVSFKRLIQSFYQTFLVDEEIICQFYNQINNIFPIEAEK